MINLKKQKDPYSCEVISDLKAESQKNTNKVRKEVRNDFTQVSV